MGRYKRQILSLRLHGFGSKSKDPVCAQSHSRFWNIFYRHGMVGTGKPVTTERVSQNLNEATDFCTRLRVRDFDTGLDCNAKLFDMARTALSISKIESSGELRTELISSVYKVLGLLSMVSHVR